MSPHLPSHRRSLVVVGVAAAAAAAVAAPPRAITAAAYGEPSAVVRGAPPHHFLHVSFAVSTREAPFDPHQSFVVLTARATGKRTTFVAKPTIGVAHQYAVDLDAAREGLNGTFDVEVLVGDAALSNPWRWHATEGVELLGCSASLPPAPVPPLYSTPLLFESDTTLEPLRELQHAFRAPDAPRPLLLSAASTAVLVALFSTWAAATVTGGMGWVRGPATLWAARFHVLFGALLCCIAAHWLGAMTFLSLLQLVGLIGASAAAVAHHQ